MAISRKGNVGNVPAPAHLPAAAHRFKAFPLGGRCRVATDEGSGYNKSTANINKNHFLPIVKNDGTRIIRVCGE